MQLLRKNKSQKSEDGDNLTERALAELIKKSQGMPFTKSIETSRNSSQDVEGNDTVFFKDVMDWKSATPFHKEEVAAT